ncbi:ABC transporter ATP-binding protein [Amycolatopsis sp. NPDC021455]|uniref:ABC transporter ATP-binding protein n=1 Tax=Amycolatopsis sp. NPDC021455 TaxID=3154901 RepID=UPI0033CC30AD
MKNGTARRLGRLLIRDPRLPTGMAVTGLVGVLLTAAGPWLLGQATNLVIAGAAGHRLDFPAIGRVLLAATGAYAGAGLCAVLQGRLANTAAQRVLMTLRNQVETKIARLPLGYFDSRPRGEILSRVTNDIDNVGVALQQVFGQFVIPLLSIIGMLAVMFAISWPLALIALVTAPVSVAVAGWLGRRARPGFRAQWRETGWLNAQVEEMITGHALLKAFGREEQAKAEFAGHNTRVAEATFAAQSRANTLQPAMTFLANLHYVLIAVAGGFRVATGALTVGDIQAFIQYSRQYSQPFSYLASMVGTVQSGIASGDRVFELLDAAEEPPDRPAPAPAEPTSGRVEFRHVRFRYRADEPLIEDLSLLAEPGHTVAIVGPTGAGKTTLVNLLMRFYELDAGRILLDGTDITGMSRASLRAGIGMVLQDTWLFQGTVAENIAYGAETATEDQVVAAAKAAHADWFIRTLPNGYDTVVDDEGGAALSAGEKQLLTIARAFLADPPILVLDEATSSVDTRTEALVQQAMSRLREGRTAFVIAHRLSTIRDADTIVVMAHGAIAEQGTHDSLLADGGLYAQLYQAQFAADHEGIAR